MKGFIKNILNVRPARLLLACILIGASLYAQTPAPVVEEKKAEEKPSEKPAEVNPPAADPVPSEAAQPETNTPPLNPDTAGPSRELPPDSSQSGVESSAEAKSLFLEWNAVEEAKGYIVQIRDDNESIVFERTVTTNRIDFHLQPGRYSSRIAPLNKFNRTAEWSEWKPFEVKRTMNPEVTFVWPGRIYKNGDGRILIRGKHLFAQTRVILKSATAGEILLENTRFDNDSDSQTLALSLNLSLAAAGQYDLIIENPGGLIQKKEKSITVDESPQPADEPTEPPAPGQEESQTRRDQPGGWKHLIPGLASQTEGSTIGAIVWGGSFAGLLGGALYESAAASAAVRNLGADPITNFYNNPSLLYLAGNAMTAQTDFLVLGSYSYTRFQELQHQHALHQRYAYNYGGALLALFALHSVKESGWAWKTLVPGLAQTSRGLKRGYLWMGLFAGLTAGGFSEWNAASTLSREANSNLMYQVFGNPILFEAATTSLGISGTTQLLFAAYAHDQRAVQQAEFNSHRSNYNAIGVTALSAYVLYLIDNGLSSPMTSASAWSDSAATVRLAGGPDPAARNARIVEWRFTQEF